MALGSGYNVYFVGGSMFITMAFFAWGRLWFGWKLLGLNAWYWLSKIMVPVVLATVVAVIFAMGSMCFMGRSFARVIVTGSLFEIAFLPLIWCFVLDPSERDYVLTRFLKCFRKG